MTTSVMTRSKGALLAAAVATLLSAHDVNALRYGNPCTVDADCDSGTFCTEWQDGTKTCEEPILQAIDPPIVGVLQPCQTDADCAPFDNGNFLFPAVFSCVGGQCLSPSSFIVEFCKLGHAAADCTDGMDCRAILPGLPAGLGLCVTPCDTTSCAPRRPNQRSKSRRTT